MCPMRILLITSIEDQILFKRGRGSGFASPQAQRPPRGAESYTQ